MNPDERISLCCCLYRKGKNFKANHNVCNTSIKRNLAVAYIAKVRILKQITTKNLEQTEKLMLLLISQR